MTQNEILKAISEGDIIECEVHTYSMEDDEYGWPKRKERPDRCEWKEVSHSEVFAMLARGFDTARLRVKDNSIKTKILALREDIAGINKQITELQDSCEHKNVKKEHKGDSGNYCRDDDRYWIEYDCPDCMKTWSEDV